MIWVDRLSYPFMWRLNPSAAWLSIPCESAHVGPMFMRMEVESLRMPFTRVIGLQWAMLWGICCNDVYRVGSWRFYTTHSVCNSVCPLLGIGYVCVYGPPTGGV